MSPRFPNFPYVIRKPDRWTKSHNGFGKLLSCVKRSRGT